ncbi:hypothetical protein TWF696_001000 [Orbilia brochopaga]|uniref:Uncharacterized protein n=1 Tax=Orbilia brochopaga TaxID=3140254 RepID=A0AAV9VG16_9PEZI
MTENRASTAAAAAAIRGMSFHAGLSPVESRKLSLFPATPNRSIPTSRASSIRFPRTPTRVRELRSIQEDDDISTATSAAPIAPQQNGLYRRHSSISAGRPTIGMARSPSINLGRRGSQSFLRRTQSMYAPGAAPSIYNEQPFRIEEKPAFLPASSRPGSIATPPMLRTLRDPDALGTKRPTGYGSRRRFPFSLRINMFEKARSLGYRMSRTLWWSQASLVPMPIQQVHAVTKHYGDPSYTAETSYLDPEETQTQYADTVVHHRVWENQSYLTSLDNQGPDYFTCPPVLDGQSAATSAPVRMTVAVPGTEPVQQRGFTPFHSPTDLNGIDSRRVYSALMKSLSKRLSTEGPLPEAILEEPEEPRPSRASDENVRPLRLSTEKNVRPPLSELPSLAANMLIIDDEEEEVPEQQEQTPNASNSVKRIRSDDALFSQIATPHQVWRDEQAASANAAATEAVSSGLRNLSISNVDKAEEEPAVDIYPKIVTLPQDRPVTTTPDPQSFGVSLTHYRTASGRLQENNLKGDNDGEDGKTNSQRGRILDPAFL